MTKMRVLIVDDEPLIRSGLELIINVEPDMTVVATAKNGEEAIQLAVQAKPNLILMDIQIPLINGIECIKIIRARDENVIILILTTFNEDEYVIEGLASGANGYLLKRAQYSELLQSMRDAMKGQYFLPVEVAARLVHYLHNKS